MLYIGALLLVNMPQMQRMMGDFVERKMSSQMGTTVRVGMVKVGFLGHFVIDSLHIDDRQGREMLSASRLSARVELIPLLDGRINITSAQLFDVKSNLYRQHPDTATNFQFAIDAFAGEQTAGQRPLDLKISSLIIRKADVRWNLLSAPDHTGVFDKNHIDIHDLNATLSLKALNTKKLDVRVKRLDATDSHSGFKLTACRGQVVAQDGQASLTNFDIELPQTLLHSKQTLLCYQADTTAANLHPIFTAKRWNYQSLIDHSHITPSDFAAFMPALLRATETLQLKLAARGDHEHIDVMAGHLHNADKSLHLSFSGHVPDMSRKHFAIQSDKLYVNANADKAIAYTSLIAELTGGSHAAILHQIERMGDIRLRAAASLNIRRQLEAKGVLSTSLGIIQFDAQATDLAEECPFTLSATSATGIQLHRLLQDDQWGTTSFRVNAKGRFDRKKGTLTRLDADMAMPRFAYRGHEYHDIHLNTQNEQGRWSTTFRVDDELMRLHGTTEFTLQGGTLTHLLADLHVDKVHPHALQLTNALPGETLSGHIHTELSGHDVNTLTGQLQADSILLRNATDTLRMKAITARAETLEGGGKRLTIDSDFLRGGMEGHISYTDILASLINQTSERLALVDKKSQRGSNHFDFHFLIDDPAVVRHFAEVPLVLRQPATLEGTVDDEARRYRINLQAPRILYQDTRYDKTSLSLLHENNQLRLDARTQRRQSNGTTTFATHADIDGDIRATLQWTTPNHDKGEFHTTATFLDSLGTTRTRIDIHPSTIAMNDTIWHVRPSTISLHDRSIDVDQLTVSNNDQYLRIDGRLSEQSTDTIHVNLRELDLNYFTTLLNLQKIPFGGKVSGSVHASRMFSEAPYTEARLHVDDFTLHQGALGDAAIHANWNPLTQHIEMDADLKEEAADTTSHVVVHGWIAPAANNLQFRVHAEQINLAFLNGFLRRIFNNIHGRADGDFVVTGPFNDMNITGDGLPDCYLTLRATGVEYHTYGDVIKLRPNLFHFDDVTVHDGYGHTGLVNGTLGHQNFKNFAYRFEVAFNSLLGYDEKKYNNDKFCGTVFVNGRMMLNGSDGHPLYVDVDANPARGSVFAYDTATPDEFHNTAFLTLGDATPQDATPESGDTDEEDEDDDLATPSGDKSNPYRGEIYMNINIELNSNLEVRLRMDQTAKDDAYISTYGTGTIQAQYYNKAPFVMYGNYRIQRGHYRMYLHDIIFRDLALQPGSQVAFNGNPFDADIHLICNHTLNAVPLSDLTSSSLNQNNKVKVVCILDITGKLGNMNFNFDLDMPNVNDETKQLVRSIITTEEEMNTQIVYLLALQRFYKSDNATTTNDNMSSSAMNSLLSSTLSGQLNQMLSSVIGNSSNWNFGTSLSTGEKGWEDMDVEGVLSGRLLDDRLLINGNFGYRDNAMTQSSSLIGDFDVSWRLTENGNTFLKAYNQTNDRYFTKATLNTQGVGIAYQRDFENWKELLKRNKNKKEKRRNKKEKNKKVSDNE